MSGFEGKFKLKTLKDTQKHAMILATSIKAPALISLQGDLGVGKTQWVRYFLQTYFKDKNLIVNSPSYSLVQCFEKKSKKVIHMDLFRISNGEDLDSIGFWDFFMDKNLICIEWAGLVLDKNLIQDRPIISIQMYFTSENQRELTCFFI